jgi:hypothetical protein
MGSSNDKHSKSKTWGRVIRSPGRILSSHTNDFEELGDRNRALGALATCERLLDYQPKRSSGIKRQL